MTDYFIKQKHPLTIRTAALPCVPFNDNRNKKKFPERMKIDKQHYL